MDSGCQNVHLNVKYLLGQLNTARKEINNLRQQMKSLRYIHEKDIDNIKGILQSYNEECTLESRVPRPLEETKASTSTDDDILKLKPIGIISTWFPNKRATPRQPHICGKAPGKVILSNSTLTNPDHALEGLQDFSHMWILFHFHRNDSTRVHAKVAPPRLNGLRTGVFSTRSPHRPCPIGLSLVKIIKIENYTIYFEGVDMVDQSPVLDIKPYIPQYDNPLHIEKLSRSRVEPNINDEDIQNPNRDRRSSVRKCRMFDSFIADFSLSNEDYGAAESSCRNGVEEVSRNVDVSQDEELALRLQAEEFKQASSSFGNYEGSRSILQDISDSAATTVHGSSSATAQNSLSNIDRRFDSIALSDERNRDSASTAAGNDDRTNPSQNSRLLDGADGPVTTTLCGTDFDFIHRRRALYSRVDNSPVRMGIREAPDGEEEFQSQILTPSQTVSNIRIANLPITNANLTDAGGMNANSGVDGAETNFSEVRVPEWISRPRTTTLSVVFNDRALTQLSEILEDKAEEQKLAIKNILREDPRSVYLRQRWGNQFYTFLIHDLHITCRFDDNRGIVTVFQIRHAGRICECGEPEWQCLGHSPLS